MGPVSHAALLASASALALAFTTGVQGQAFNTVVEGAPRTETGTWNIPNNLMVGDNLDGTLIIEAGGTVNGSTARLGADNVTGAVTVRDANSAWTNTGIISIGVGADGTGYLNVLNGGAVSNSSGEIGVNDGATGIVTVSGPGSEWINSAGLYVGSFGDGTLVIDNGGAVSATVTTLGTELSSFGTLTLSGSDGARGVLTTGRVVRGLGGAQVNLDGGILRATADQSSFLDDNFLPDEVVIGTGGAFFDSNGHDIDVWAQLSGRGGLTKLGAGTLMLGGTNTYTGDTSINGGTLVVFDDANLGDVSGRLSLDGGTLEFFVPFNLATTRAIVLDSGGGTFQTSFGNSTIGSDISGSGGLTKAGTGTLTLTGNNSYTGSTTISGGTLVANSASLKGPVLNNSALVFNQTLDGTFAGNIGGSGSLTKTGAGTLTLTGDNTYSGATTVSAGALRVNGSLAGLVTVGAGNVLGGTGRFLGGIHNNGTLSPGNSIGTMSVTGPLTFGAGSVYDVEVNAVGGSDRIEVYGTATLDGTVRVLPEAGNYVYQTDYVILTATSPLTTTFDGVISTSAFLDPSLIYGANDVTLRLIRNNVDFAAVAATPNQTAVAGALDAAWVNGDVPSLLGAVAALSAQDAPDAFDQLSGEIHASVAGVLIEDSQFVRDAMSGRIRAAFAGVAAGPVPVLAYGAGGAEVTSADTAGPAAWGSAFGSWGEIDSDGNAAGLDRSVGGLLMGADTPLADNWRFGLMAGYSRSSFDIDERASSGDSDNYHLGLYGGAQWGELGLRLGAAYTWHEVEAQRSIAFTGYADSLNATYGAATAQAFGEVGYRIEAGSAALEPFAGLAHVNLATEDFSEQGGAAALRGSDNSTSVTFATLGLRASSAFYLGEMEMRARGMVGWHHAFGETAPLAALAFSGGEPFTVAGAPIAEDVALVEAGLDLSLTETANFGVSYEGQFASGGQSHAFKAQFGIAF